MGRKDAVHRRGKCPHKPDADSHSVRMHEGKMDEMGEKESKKETVQKERQRKYVSAGKTNTVHTGNTRQTHIAHRGV